MRSRRSPVPTPPTEVARRRGSGWWRRSECVPESANDWTSAMGNPLHYSLELPQRCLQLIDELWPYAEKTQQPNHPNLGPLTTTFLISMSMPIINLPIERIERGRNGESYADDRPIDPAVTKAVDHMLGGQTQSPIPWLSPKVRIGSSAQSASPPDPEFKCNWLHSLPPSLTQKAGPRIVLRGFSLGLPDLGLGRRPGGPGSLSSATLTAGLCGLSPSQVSGHSHRRGGRGGPRSRLWR
jgi:hypothetical protein